MRTAESRWAAGLAGVLRPLGIILGSTFAVHRLALRLEPDETGGPAALADRSYPARLGDALVPDGTTMEAIGRTAVLAGLAAVAGLTIGWSWVTVRHRLQRNRVAAERPVSGLWTGLVLALALPGLAWLPLYRWAVGQGLVPEGPLPPLDSGADGARSIVLWSILVGLAIAPTTAAALSGGRSWASPGGGGHPALAPLAARPSSRPLWRVGLPTLTFGTALALAEVVSGNGGLVDRFIGAMREGRPDDLLLLATPLIVAGALLAPLTDLGDAVLRRVERPRVPGSDRTRPSGRATMAAIGLGGLVLAAAIAGVIAGPDPESAGEALSGPRLGGPWLGTDALGRSLAVRTGAALGATLVGSAVPALIATMVGAGLAYFRRSQGARVAAVSGGLLDLLSWPAALVVPLAIWPLASDGSTLLDPVAVQVTALLLVPSATRLLVRPLSVRSRRLARLAATFCLLHAAALSIQLFATFVAPAGGGDWPTLGWLTASGTETYDASPWPLVAPVLAAIAAGAALYWLADALTGVGHEAAESADPSLPQSSTAPGRVLLAPRPESADGDPAPFGGAPEPPRVTLADDAEPRPTPADPAITLGASTASIWPPVAVPDDEDQVEASDRPDDDTGVTGGADALEAAVDPTEAARAAGSASEAASDDSDDSDDPVAIAGARDEVVGEGDDVEPDLDAEDDDRDDRSADLDAEDDDRDEIDPGEDESIDIRDDISVASAVDVPPPDDERSIEDEASQTIELRPSDLRRAGLRPDEP